MEGAMPNTPLDREEDKKEIFARVWKRVMGEMCIRDRYYGM